MRYTKKMVKKTLKVLLIGFFFVILHFSMKEKIQKTLKSSETEDWLDLHVVRPLCYYFAVAFAKLDIHPNTVTITSMFVGAGSALLFAHGCFVYEGTTGLVYNIVAVLLLCFADILDCTDGQLARMTGKKSPLGRILDGAAGFVWFIPIYLALVWRFYNHHDIEFQWLGIENTEQNTLIATAVVFVLGIISGVWGMAGQQRLADYYIQVHLFFLKGEKGAELDNSVDVERKYRDMTPENSLWAERYFQKTYIGYTKKQEAVTPEFQRLMKNLKEKYGTSAADIPEDLRQEIHDASLPVIFWNGLLTFNFRSLWFFIFCLLDVPALNFIWEIFIMGALYFYVNKRHEAFCKRINQKISE